MVEEARQGFLWAFRVVVNWHRRRSNQVKRVQGTEAFSRWR